MARGKTPRPRTKHSRAVELGVAAHALVTEDRAALEPRLSPALIDGLGADLSAFGELAPGAIQERAERKASTVGQHEAAARVAALVSGMRLAVTNAGLGAAARKAWGVGQKVDARVVKRTVAAGEMAARRGATAPDEARTAGILPSDLEALAAALDALRGADAAQEQKKTTAKVATRARDDAHRRIEDAVKRIAAAGVLQFGGTDPGRAAKYAELLGGPKRRKPAPAPPS